MIPCFSTIIIMKIWKTKQNIFHQEMHGLVSAQKIEILHDLFYSQTESSIIGEHKGERLNLY